MVIIPCLKLQTIRKEGNLESGVEENEEKDSVKGTAVLRAAGGSARNAKKPAVRNSTYEVSPGNDENSCEYLTILSFAKGTWGWLGWVVERFIMLVVVPGNACEATSCEPPGLAQPQSAVPALPQALTALGFNPDFFWGLCPVGLSQTPLCCLLFV